MKFKKIIGLSFIISLTGTSLLAQETNQIEQLQKQLHQMQENFEKAQRDQKQQIEALTKKLDDLQKNSGVTSATNQSAEPKTAQQRKLEQELAAQLEKELGTNLAPGIATARENSPTPKTFFSSNPIAVARGGSAYM
ncbi:MAG: hypothetical protein ACR2H1_14160, partial [Limisphaerales bacterium]